MVEAPHGVGAAGGSLGIFEAAVVRDVVPRLESVEIQHVVGNDGRFTGLWAPVESEHIE